jgi:hypothetical protein
MNCNFKRIDIWHMARGSTSVCWELSSDFFPKGPLHFYVDFGRAGTDTWLALNAEPIIDDCCFIDPCQRTWEMITDGYYRVRLLQPGLPDCPVITSQPTPADGHLDKRDWLSARDIVRREHLQQRKIDGTVGFLLKRKKFGVQCPTCLEWDTKEVTDSDCSICYGTGIVGGYYPGIEYYFTLQAGMKRRLNVGQPPRGTFADMQNQGSRCVLYPKIDTRDIWVEAASDARYIIDSYTVVAQMKGLPLVAVAELRLAPATDVVYAVPIDGTPPLVEAPAVVPCDVHKGLNATYEDWA